MTCSKLLAGAAALALLAAAPGASFAQGRGGGGHMGGGGGGHMGGGGGGHMGGGGGMGGGARMGGGGHMGGGMRMGGAGGPVAAAPATAGRAGAVGTQFNGGGRDFADRGSRGRDRDFGRGDRDGRRGGFFPGFAAGAALGSFAFGGPDYYGYGPDYYDYGYYNPGPEVAVVVPGGGGDSVAYCEQRFRSYDPASGTYLGYDGQRHPCP